MRLSSFSLSVTQRHSDTRCDVMCDTAATLTSPAKRAQPITVAHVGNKRSNYISLPIQAATLIRLVPNEINTGFWGAQQWPNSIGLAANANWKLFLYRQCVSPAVTPLLPCIALLPLLSDPSPLLTPLTRVYNVVC